MPEGITIPPETMNTSRNDEPANGGSRDERQRAVDIVGWIYLGIGAVTIVVGLGGAALSWIEESHFYNLGTVVGGLLLVPGSLMAFAGQSLRIRRHWRYCFVIAVITTSIFIPAGTILGIYTILLLNRDETRAAFRDRKADLTS